MGRYLETKPADLGPCCVLFETYGRCPYGVTCRFAGAHLGPEGQNLVQRVEAQAPPVRNGLDKALQHQLRKRRFCFERAEQALRQLGKGHLPGPIPPATVPEGAPGQDICDTQQAPLGPGTSPAPGSPVQTCGPLTDEDVVRLRPCEKRQVCASGRLLRTLAVWRAEGAEHAHSAPESQGWGAGPGVLVAEEKPSRRHHGGRNIPHKGTGGVCIGPEAEGRSAGCTGQGVF